MLKFINQKGKKVMELKDNGDVSFVSEELKATGLLQSVEFTGSPEPEETATKDEKSND